MLTVQDLRNFALGAQQHVSSVYSGAYPVTSYRRTYVDNSWNSWRTHHYYHGSQTTGSCDTEKNEKKSKDNAAAAALGLFFVAIGVIGVGSIFGSLQGRMTTLYETDQMASSIERYGFPKETSNKAKRSFMNLLGAKRCLDQRRVDVVKWPTIVFTGMLAGGIASFIGGAHDLPYFITAGQTTLLVSSILGLGLLGYHTWDETPQIESRRVDILSQEFIQETETNIFLRIFNAIYSIFCY